jgi:hypothetical protein
MSEQDEHETEFEYPIHQQLYVCDGDREYRKALTILGDGLHQVAESPTTIDMVCIVEKASNDACLSGLQVSRRISARSGRLNPVFRSPRD